MRSGDEDVRASVFEPLESRFLLSVTFPLPGNLISLPHPPLTPAAERVLLEGEPFIGYELCEASGSVASNDSCDSWSLIADHPDAFVLEDKAEASLSSATGIIGSLSPDVGVPQQMDYIDYDRGLTGEYSVSDQGALQATQTGMPDPVTRDTYGAGIAPPASEGTVMEALGQRSLPTVSRDIEALSPDLGLPQQVDNVTYYRGVTPEYNVSDHGVVHAGSVTTAGDGILNADALRALFGGLSGEGVKVGVISDGVDDWATVAADPYYDLPNSITVRPQHPGSGNEGTAMLEIIHDLAPEAELYFAPGLESPAGMIESIEWLVNQGVHVIVDDVAWFSEPMFQDGAIAQAAVDAISEGVVYVSAAGNGAQTHYQGQYEPTGGGNPLHLFHTGDNLLVVQVPTGGVIKGALQWSDGWGESGNDYDLLLLGWTGSWGLVAQSSITQDGDDNPYEFVAYENSQGYSYLAWTISKYSGATRELEFYTWGDIQAIDADDVVAGDSIFGHPGAEGVIAVGAIDAGDPGNDDIEAFSSRGASTIYTDFANQASIQRDVLDVAGIDGVHTAIGDGFHLFGDPNRDWKFYGTSAAAPHIAAIAGLLLEIAPSLTPAEVGDLITGNAVDLGDTGYDAVFGYGRGRMPWLLSPPPRGRWISWPPATQVLPAPTTSPTRTTVPARPSNSMSLTRLPGPTWCSMPTARR